MIPPRIYVFETDPGYLDLITEPPQRWKKSAAIRWLRSQMGSKIAQTPSTAGRGCLNSGPG